MDPEFSGSRCRHVFGPGYRLHSFHANAGRGIRACASIAASVDTRISRGPRPDLWVGLLRDACGGCLDAAVGQQKVNASCGRFCDSE